MKLEKCFHMKLTMLGILLPMVHQYSSCLYLRNISVESRTGGYSQD